ncbi:hypothetical protein [Hyphobacterium sp.]|uniref:hypothetical protein n=1 Tax=Hyphobacterium sp. TaxID=2004662 RepID=UPI003B51C4AF
MTATIFNLAEFRPGNPSPEPPDLSPPAVAQPPAAPNLPSDAVGGTRQPRLLTIGDKVIFDRGRGQVTEGVIIHLNPRDGLASVMMTDGPHKGWTVARPSTDFHIVDTGRDTRVETAS